MPADFIRSSHRTCLSLSLPISPLWQTAVNCEKQCEVFHDTVIRLVTFMWVMQECKWPSCGFNIPKMWRTPTALKIMEITLCSVWFICCLIFKRQNDSLKGAFDIYSAVLKFRRVSSCSITVILILVMVPVCVNALLSVVLLWLVIVSDVMICQLLSI